MSVRISAHISAHMCVHKSVHMCVHKYAHGTCLYKCLFAWPDWVQTEIQNDIVLLAIPEELDEGIRCLAHRSHLDVPHLRRDRLQHEYQQPARAVRHRAVLARPGSVGL